MANFLDLPTHATNDSEMAQWQAWAACASPAQLFEAFLSRLHPSRILATPDLEPIPALLASRLQAHLEPSPDIAPQESEAA